MSNKRMFELSEGAAVRFWEVWRDGTAVVTRFGRVGGACQTTLKEVGSAEDADHVIDQQARDKTAKGYVEYGGGTAPAKVATAIEAGSLETQLANLTDDASHLVFGDWLQAQGHPWGELISLQYNAAKETNAKKRAALETAAEQLLEQHGATILGPLAGTAYSRFEWHLGFLRTATLGTPPDPVQILDALKALLALPVARKVEGIIFSPVPGSLAVRRDWDAAEENVVDPWTDLDGIAKLLPERVTHLGFGAWPAPAAAAYVRIPTFTAIRENFPKLKRLELTGWSAEEPGPLDMEHLVDVDLRFCNARSSDLDALIESGIPPLRRISITCGGTSYCVLDDIYPSEDGYPDGFDSSDMEQLEIHGVSSSVYPDKLVEYLDSLDEVEHVGIRSASLDVEGWQAVLASERIPQIKSLDLSGGTIDDDIAKVFIAAKGRLAHLELLDFERNCIGAAMAKKLVAALPKARVGDQRKSSAPELFTRYVAVME